MVGGSGGISGVAVGVGVGGAAGTADWPWAGAMLSEHEGRHRRKQQTEHRGRAPMLVQTRIHENSFLKCALLKVA